MFRTSNSLCLTSLSRCNNFSGFGEITSLDTILRSKPYEVEEERDEDENENNQFEFEQSIDGDPNPTHRLGRSLLRLAKVNYREISLVPEWILKKQYEITHHRTPAQIRRCMRNWMVKYDRDKQLDYMKKPLIWRSNDAVSNKSGNVLIYGPEETIAFTQHHMPAILAINKRIFQELKKYLPKFSPANMIDFGCGVGTSGAAAKEIWGDQFKKYSGIDISRGMLDSAKIMLSDTGIDSVFWEKSSSAVKAAVARGERFDLAVISYTLSELTSDSARRAATQLMFEMLNVGGCLVIIEPGSPVGSHTVRTGRQFILDTFNNNDNRNSSTDSDSNMKRRGNHEATSGNGTGNSFTPILPPMDGIRNDQIRAFTISPCTHDKPCPLGHKVYCSFSQRAHSGLIRTDSEEKFSYVVIQKRLAPECNVEMDATLNRNYRDYWTVPSEDRFLVKGGEVDSTPTPREILIRYLDCNEEEDVTELTKELIDEIDWEVYSPPLHREEWSRVIRSPIKCKGHVIMDVCNPDGEITRTTFARSSVDHVPSLYSALRKASWGGLFPADIDTDDRDKFSPLLKTEKRKAKSVVASHRFVRPVERDEEAGNKGRPMQDARNHLKSHSTAAGKGKGFEKSASNSVKKVQEHEQDKKGKDGNSDSSIEISKKDEVQFRGRFKHKLPIKRRGAQNENSNDEE